jgi:hypothetical protein
MHITIQRSPILLPITPFPLACFTILLCSLLLLGITAPAFIGLFSSCIKLSAYAFKSPTITSTITARISINNLITLPCHKAQRVASFACDPFQISLKDQALNSALNGNLHHHLYCSVETYHGSLHGNHSAVPTTIHHAPHGCL